MFSCLCGLLERLAHLANHEYQTYVFFMKNSLDLVPQRAKDTPWAKWLQVWFASVKESGSCCAFAIGWQEFVVTS